VRRWSFSASVVEDVKYPPELAGLRVLVVDDEADARDLVKEVLERGGAVVTLAATAAGALEWSGEITRRSRSSRRNWSWWSRI
jgi:PleD family two-component response regulator